MNPAAPHPAPLAAPPITPGALSTPAHPAAWPSVIGIISIVLGCLSTFFSVLKMIWYAFILSGIATNFFDSLLGETGQPNPLRIVQTHTPFIAASEALNLAIAILLIVVGFALVRRSPRAPLFARSWAILKVVVAILGMALGIWLQQETLKAVMAAQPNATTGPGAAAVPAFAMGGAILGGLFTLLFLCAWPIFLLIWFHLVFVKAECSKWRTLTS